MTINTEGKQPVSSLTPSIGAGMSQSRPEQPRIDNDRTQRLERTNGTIQQ
ncbi:hypothetical protein IQ268_25285 [Oculatella sp. LEGE 06141]|nr:hypothetical protein [Oculatella sp. LEGE 06141]MBE9181886.1 hypothetical protein [Oculatella sp. LEGE 06141]